MTIPILTGDGARVNAAARDQSAYWYVQNFRFSLKIIEFYPGSVAASLTPISSRSIVIARRAIEYPSLKGGRNVDGKSRRFSSHWLPLISTVHASGHDAARIIEPKGEAS
jgi:hypothetical protein